eukprot:symbB.v1.2.024086.t2/scaffold2256.1/size84244/3
MPPFQPTPSVGSKGKQTLAPPLNKKTSRSSASFAFPVNMGKRAAQSAATQQAKVQKVEIDTFAQELAPVLKHLEQAQLNEASIDMLQSVAPFCLKTMKEERHAFQHSMVESIETALKGIEAQRGGILTAAEQHLAEILAKQDQAATRLSEAETKMNGATEVHQSKAEVQNSIEVEAKEASKVLKEAQEHEDELARDKAATLKENEALEKFLVTFTALKDGTFTGKEWRERNKAIDETLKVVEIQDLSLKAALPTSLRTKPGERGRFSLKAINFCEVALASQGEKLKTKMSGFDQEATVRAEKSQQLQEACSDLRQRLEGMDGSRKVASGHGNDPIDTSFSWITTKALKAVEERLAAAQAETGTAKEDLDICLKEKASIEKEMKALPGAAQKSQKAVEKAKDQVSQTQAVLSNFDQLKNRTPEETTPQDATVPETMEAPQPVEPCGACGVRG